MWGDEETEEDTFDRSSLFLKIQPTSGLLLLILLLSLQSNFNFHTFTAITIYIIPGPLSLASNFQTYLRVLLTHQSRSVKASPFLRL